MLFRHVWIWTDLGNGVRRFQGIGFGGHQGSSNLVERASGFEDLGQEGIRVRGFGILPRTRAHSKAKSSNPDALSNKILEPW